nr:MAG TPA: hypothetical protein [Caudoviricetes sp.]
MGYTRQVYESRLVFCISLFIFTGVFYENI